MRAVFIGASSLTIMAAHLLLKRNHEVVIIEQDKSIIDELSSELDCGFINGDGGKPAILKEVDPKDTDVLFCLTSSDQANILASLVGRSLGFKRIITKIEDPEFEHICIELGLENTIIPSRTIGRYLADMLEGQDPLELSTMIRDEARTFSFVVREGDPKSIAELKLPTESRVIIIYRDNKLVVPDDSSKLKKDDEVVIITRRENLDQLHERWGSS
jgi:trk system potassium uptake protein TrkA